MGMLSRAMKKRKKEMMETLEVAEIGERVVKGLKEMYQSKVEMPMDLAESLHEISTMRGISVEQLVITHMTSVANAYQNQKILGLAHTMPYGKYRGVLIEDMIRADPRYVNWLASNSEIFVLDEAATALLETMV